MKSLAEKAIIFGIGVTLLALFVVAIVQYQVIPHLIANEVEIVRAEKLSSLARDLASATSEIEEHANALAAKHDSASGLAHLRAVAGARALVRKMREAAAGNTARQHDVETIDRAFDAFAGEIDAVVQQSLERGKPATGDQVLRGPALGLRRSILETVYTLTRREQDTLTRTRAALLRGWSGVRWLVGVGLGMAIISLAVAIGLIFVALRRRTALGTELMHERYLLRTLLNHVPLGIFFRDSNGRYTRVSRTWAQLAGIEQSSQMIGKTASDYLPPELAEIQVQRDRSVMETGQPLLNQERHLRLNSGIDGWLLTSLVPLYDQANRVSGTLGVALDITDRKRAELTREEEAVRQAAWTTEIEQRNREEGMLAELSELLQTCATEAEAGALIGRYMPVICPSTSGCISMIKASRNLVEPVAKWNWTGAQAGAFAPDECWALRRGREHNSGEGRLEPVCEHGCTPSAGQCLCVPMMAHGESIGVFMVSTAEPAFDEKMRRQVYSVAGRIGLALASLRLRDALRALSIRDPLSGLFNRRYMEESGERELCRAIRYRVPLAVVMIDLDHFKRFNDTFGHEAGDALVSEFGVLLRTQTRREDIACRYGGEEFLLILPELDADAACQCAEKLRQAMPQMVAEFNGQALGQITASFGVAAYPEHGDAFAALVRLADKALYAAKRAGRDRVMVAPSLQMIDAVDEKSA